MKEKEISMFGKQMFMAFDDGHLALKPFTLEEITSDRVLAMFADHRVTQYTLMQGSPTKEMEAKWFESIYDAKNVWVWGVYVCKGEFQSNLLGITTIEVNDPFHLATTGILLFDKSSWGKGVAKTAHIARTHYAAKHLDIKTIQTTIMQPNIGSLKALQSVGYFSTGYKLADDFRNGEYIHHQLLQWINPRYQKYLLKDLPPELKDPAKEGVQNAGRMLKMAKSLVKYEVKE